MMREELKAQMEQVISSIDSDSVHVIKKVMKPPPMIEETYRVMLLVLGTISTYDEISYLDCRPRLDHTNPPLPERMRQCKLDEISEEARTHLQQLVDDEQFLPEIMQKKLSICGPLCAWLRLVNGYIIISQ